MTKVICQCGHEYDLGNVVITARHADATVWNCPACGVASDDRTWARQPYTKVSDVTFPFVDKTGRIYGYMPKQQ